ncbi:hypothetical protein BN13_300012 [Nostocoides jenkinsii Ben 74]|uniref:Uncharacterized protein n=1 Tax=Nostocoides jenkinsii Ben 74 TaxID=1193518 RepID=A0A077M7B4_9MICO|nr:hypothetical protein BN13_300012 [Tetrasphaera jenkinsii Ben 74]
MLDPQLHNPYTDTDRFGLRAI